MDDKMLESKLLYILRNASEDVLKRLGIVIPFAAQIDRHGENVQTYYPKDQHRTAAFAELFELAVAYVSECSRSPSVGAVALVSTLESGGQTAIGIQIETRSSAFFVIHPYKKTIFGGWKISDPQVTSDLIAERSLNGA